MRKFLIRSQIYFLMTVFSRISKSNKKYSKQPIFNKEPRKFKLLIEPKKQKNQTFPNLVYKINSSIQMNKLKLKNSRSKILSLDHNTSIIIISRLQPNKFSLMYEKRQHFECRFLEIKMASTLFGLSFIFTFLKIQGIY